MKIIQMTMDEDLIEAIDNEARLRSRSRSAFTRDALRHYLLALKEQELERKHQEGYRKNPVKKGEFDDWEMEQVWPD